MMVRTAHTRSSARTRLDEESAFLVLVNHTLLGFDWPRPTVMSRRRVGFIHYNTGAIGCSGNDGLDSVLACIC